MGHQAAEQQYASHLYSGQGFAGGMALQQWISSMWQYTRQPEVKRVLQVLQALSSLLFVVLYVRY